MILITTILNSVFEVVHNWGYGPVEWAVEARLVDLAYWISIRWALAGFFLGTFLQYINRLKIQRSKETPPAKKPQLSSNIFERLLSHIPPNLSIVIIGNWKPEILLHN